MSQWVVSAKTNAVSAAKWVKEAKRIASGMTKDGVQRTIRDGYLIVARLLNGRRDVTVLDSPVSVRAIGIVGGVEGANFVFTTRVPVARSRDAFLPLSKVALPIPEPQQSLLPFVADTFKVAQYPIGPPAADPYQIYSVDPSPINGAPNARHSVSVTTTQPGAFEHPDQRISFFPLSPSRPWWMSMEGFGRQSGYRVTLAEEYIKTHTGHRLFPTGVPADLGGWWVFNVPKSAHTERGGVVVGVVPVIDTGPEDYDYGEMALFATFTTLPVSPDTEATTVHRLIAFPSTPQFEQQQFRSMPGAWRPAFCQGQMVGNDDGSFSMYGYYFTELEADRPRDGGGVRYYTFQIVTRFRLTITPSGTPTWDVLDCCVTAEDTLDKLQDSRRVNSSYGEFFFPDCPDAYYSQGQTWAVTRLFDTGGDPLTLRESVLGLEGTGPVVDTLLSVVQGGNEVARGKPPGAQLTVPEALGAGQLIRLIQTPGSSSGFQRRHYTCMHADAPQLTGFCLSLFRGSSGPDVAYWDTKLGWGWWGWDVTLLNESVGVPALSGGLPRLSVFKQAALDEDGGVVAPPSLLVSAEYGANQYVPLTFVAISGKLDYLVQISGLAVDLIGSPLTGKSELNNLYKRG